MVVVWVAWVQNSEEDLFYKHLDLLLQMLSEVQEETVENW